MSRSVRILIEAMGGDEVPEEIVRCAEVVTSEMLVDGGPDELRHAAIRLINLFLLCTNQLEFVIGKGEGK